MKALSKLLPILKAHGVSSFKTGDGLEVSFHVEQPKYDQPSQLIEDTQAEATLPPDLRTDKVNAYDSILEWSAPPSADMQELPLTGDAPL